MKQYTTKEQTKYLIELGFPEPKSVSEVNYFDEAYYSDIELEYNYSIGELIEFLGLYLININPYTLLWKEDEIGYNIQYQIGSNNTIWRQIKGELIDKLYDICVELKNNGRI